MDSGNILWNPKCKHCGEQVPLLRVTQHSMQCQGPDLNTSPQPTQLQDFLTRRRPSAEQSASSLASAALTSLDPIARLGYYIDERGEIRNVASKRHVNEEIRFSAQGENLQKELLEALVSFIQSTMVASGPTGGFNRIMVPSIEEAVHENARCPIFCSQGWRHSENLMIMISSSRVQAGMWSRSCCFDHGLFFGSMLPFLEAAKVHAMGVIILNPYANSITSRDNSSFVPKVQKTRVRLSETPERHILYAWDRCIRTSSSENLYFVANGYGGVLTQHLLTERDEARDRTRCIALTNSSHTWSSSEKSEANTMDATSASGTDGGTENNNVYRTPIKRRNSDDNERATSPMGNLPQHQDSAARIVFTERAINWVMDSTARRSSIYSQHIESSESKKA